MGDFTGEDDGDIEEGEGCTLTERDRGAMEEGCIPLTSSTTPDADTRDWQIQ